uniref:Uncharacterized protein n=1 Tax=Rhizophora mucronata TaxID=61149 RepID=A0A2P2N656_RHIMU
MNHPPMKRYTKMMTEVTITREMVIIHKCVKYKYIRVPFFYESP